MKLAIDLTSILYDRGVSRYTSNLLRVLTQQKNLEVCLYGSSLRRKHELEHAVHKLLPSHPDSHLAIDPYPPKLLAWLWRCNLSPIGKHFSKLDVIHSWDWMQPPDTEPALVSTIHDLAMLRYPETAHPEILSAHRRAWKVLKEREAHIIAVSKATKQDIIEFLEIPSFRVHVVPEALPFETQAVSESMTEEQQATITAQFQLDSKPYILAVGTREPRKNLRRLIEAWQPLAKDVRLLIAGEAGWDDSESVSGVQPEFLGRVSQRKLAQLYTNAAVFAYPSLYEGFGLPILEAFYHGTPVITSNVSSMPEVAGNAAELVNPESVPEIRAAIEKILGEDDAAARKRLQRMIIRLQMFSWQKAADETMAVYRAAVHAKKE